MPLLFILPCIVFLLAMTIFPLLYSLFLGFNKWELAVGLPREFTGLSNYGRLITDPRFWNAMRNMAYELVFGVGAQLVLGLGLALLLDRAFKGRGMVVTLFLLPTMIAPVVVGTTFRMIYHYSYGPLNYFLKAVNIPGLNWLADPKLAFPSIIIADTWEWTPFMMLILLAGLQSIPSELHEVASVDGASSWQKFLYITLPLLKRTMIIAVLIRSMDAFKLFDLVVLLTQGGPGIASETLPYYNYLVGFKYFSMGYAAALAYVQLIVLIILAQIFLKYWKREGG
ncbi:MAG: sugar ABC transporter permease [Deltaproteobacteria bacterium]|nr:sugar ABC transporter permease [Deltaproteobacteria bacterium]